MNSVSWFIYLGDVTQGLATFLVVILIVSGVAGFMYTIFLNATQPNEASRFLLPKWYFVTAWLACGLLACLIPSKQTFYAIAASEVGERLISSTSGQEITSQATRALKNWIERQAGDTPKKKEE